MLYLCVGCFYLPVSFFFFSSFFAFEQTKDYGVLHLFAFHFIFKPNLFMRDEMNMLKMID